MDKKIYAPGVYSDISNADYHASAGISRSMIMTAKKSMLNYYHYYIKQDRFREKTEAMLLGSVVNTLAIEPHKFDEEFLLYQKAIGKGSRALNKAFKAAADDKDIISPELYAQALEMASAVRADDRAMLMINGAKIEHSLFWHDDETGLLCKARPDIWNKQINAIGDLKTALNADIRVFKGVIEEKGYNFQAAMILDGICCAQGIPVPPIQERMNNEYFVFIVIPKDIDYKPYIYVLGWMAIEAGRQEYKNALKLIKLFEERNSWDADRKKIIDIDFDPWQLNRANHFSKQLEIYQ